MRRTKSANVKRGRHQILDDSQIGGGRNILDFFIISGTYFLFFRKGVNIFGCVVKGGGQKFIASFFYSLRFKI